MTELVKWAIPADFISSRVALTAPEVAEGLRLEWLTLDDGLKLARSSPAIGASVAQYLNLAATSDPVEVVALRDLARDQSGDERRVWLFLGLAWLLENRASYDEPLTIIDRISEDFDHPELIRHLIYWMPPKDGKPVGVKGLERRWEELVEALGKEFRARKVVEP